jgi:hypothetical protein
VAADFFTLEAWTRHGLTRFLVLFLIDLSTRRIAGVTRGANGRWMSQVARNLSDAAEGFLIGKRYLIHDRDPLFTAEFLEILRCGVGPRPPGWGRLRATDHRGKWRHGRHLSFRRRTLLLGGCRPRR